MRDDTISRAAAINALADYIHNVDRVYSTGKLTHEDCVDAAHSVLDKLPSATDTNVATTDTISRRAAIAAVHRNYDTILDFRSDGETVANSVEDILSELPTAQLGEDIRAMCGECDAWNQYKNYSQPEWIQCKERLPKEKDAGILKKLGIEKRSEYVLATIEAKGERMTVKACTHDGKWNWDMKYAFPDYKVVAWMPFPEPWKDGGHHLNRGKEN